jgi:hypothetical protein
MLLEAEDDDDEMMSFLGAHFEALYTNRPLTFSYYRG